MVSVEAFPTRSPDDLWWWAVYEREVVEVGVLRDHHVVMSSGIRPHVTIGRLFEAGGGDVGAAVERVGEAAEDPT